MLKQEGLSSPSSQEKFSSKQEKQPKIKEIKQLAPESQEAQNFYISTEKLLDKYHQNLIQYNKELMSSSYNDEIAKDLKTELQQMWDQLHNLTPTIKEHEYMVLDQDIKNKMIELSNEIDNLPTFPGQDLEPREAKKPALNRNIDTVIVNRENAKKQAEEHLRNQEKVKAMRKQLAKLKSSFAGSYKMNTVHASILLPQIVALHKNKGVQQKGQGGILNWIKNIAGAPDKSTSKFTAEERAKYLALDLTKFKADLKEIQQREKEYNTLWNQVQKTEKSKNFDIVEDLEPDDSISFVTLREGFNDEIRNAYNEGDSAKALQLKQELDEAYKNLQAHFPEILRERVEQYPMDNFSDQESINPTEVTREFESAKTLKTQSTKDLEIESAVTLKTQKTEQLEKEKQVEAERKERQAKIEETIKSFGGDEKARQKASQMWEDAFVKLAMVERSGILEPGKKIGNALDYVHAYATMQMKATEMEQLMAQAEQKIINDTIDSFGGGEAGRDKAGEIWNLANQMMGQDSSEAEVQRQFGFTRMEYVEAWADLSKAHIKKDKDLIESLEQRVYNMTKKLLGEEGQNLTKKRFDSEWNFLVDSGASRMGNMRGIGQNRARQELGQQIEKISGPQPIELTTEASRSTERISGPKAYSMEWAMNLLPNANLEWDKIANTISAKPYNERRTILNTINNEINNLINKLNRLDDISEEYKNLKAITEIMVGNPPEATRYVMLKVFTDGAFFNVKPNDAKAKKAILDTIKAIDQLLKSKPETKSKSSLKEESPTLKNKDLVPTLKRKPTKTLKRPKKPSSSHSPTLRKK